MEFGVARVEDHEADEGGHVGDAVECRVEEAAEARDLVCEAGDLAVEHVEEVGDGEDARQGQKVRVNPAPRQAPHHRADYAPRAASDARPEQLYKAFPRALDVRG